MDFSTEKSTLLDKARKEETLCNWDDAARYYRALLDISDSPDACDILIRMGECQELAAYQTEKFDSLKERLSKALSAYVEVENRAKDPGSIIYRTARGHRLRIESTQTQTTEVRRKLLDQAIDLQRGVIDELKLTNHREAWQEACEFQMALLLERSGLESGESLQSTIREGIEVGKQLLETANSPNLTTSLAMARAYLTSFHLMGFHLLGDLHKDPGLMKNTVNQALAMAPQVRDKRTKALLHILAAQTLHAWFRDTSDQQVALGVEAAGESRDRQLIGFALSLVMQFSRFRSIFDCDEEQANIRFTKSMADFEEAKRMLHELPDTLSHGLLALAYGEAVFSHYLYATHFVGDRGRRKSLLGRGLKLFYDGKKAAEGTSSIAVVLLGIAGAETLRYLSLIESQNQERVKMLSEAISTTESMLGVAEGIFPLFHWALGVWYILNGSLLYQLAEQRTSPDEHKEILAQAKLRFRKGLEKLKGEDWRALPATATLAILGNNDFYFLFFKALGSNYELIHEPEIVREQMDLLAHTAQSYVEANAPARAAEALFLKAQLQSRSGWHLEASKDYLSSAVSYRKAIAQTPKLNEFYKDLEQYMLAWSKIEEARDSQFNWRYLNASELYAQAATLLESTRRWASLAQQYRALSALEEAEQASLEDKGEPAIKMFVRAADFFASLRGLRLIDVPSISRALTSEERKDDQELKVVELGEDYCRARALVEEARLFNKKGEHNLSAGRFASAAKILSELAEKEQSQEGKTEMHTLSRGYHAWQIAQEAEASSNSERYGEAANLLEDVAQNSTTEKMRKGTLADAAYCRALQLSTTLRVTRDAAIYRQTKQYLETAVGYYSDVGLSRSARWTCATERMLDGLIYLSQAEGELHVPSKAEFYELAERNFEAASRLFGESEHEEKRAQADRYLRDARERHRIFPNPASALDPPVILQGEQGHFAVGVTNSQPIEVEQFESANIQAKLVPSQNEITSNEVIELLVEIVSAGRIPAILVKLTDMGEDIEVQTIGEKYHMEDGIIKLKGVRLQPFDTFELRMQIRPLRAGEFSLSPRILYLDEFGKYQEHRPLPITFTVRQESLPASSDDKMNETTPKSSIEFKGAGGRTVFEYLVKAFVEDYMIKKLFQEHSGWRSLTEISEKTKIPRGTLYGKQGRYGLALNELLSRGLVEYRIFTGQRGRGGESVKLRIAYEKEPVKRCVDSSVSRTK